MADSKKKKSKTGPDKLDDLDDLNFDDMDFGDLEDIDESSRKPTKAGVAKELGKQAGSGFLDSLAKETAKRSLPSEYEHNYTEAMEYKDLANEVFSRNKEKIDSSLFKLTREVQKILPFKIKAMDNYIERKKAELESDISQSEEAARNASIESSISSIFDKQLELQKDLEAKAEAKDEVDRKERFVSTKLNIDRLTSIDNSISNLTAFTLQISKEYYRKSLELQYKSYFIQSDMLKTMKDSYKAFSLQFDGIVKNTGLPDFVKLRNTERLSEVVRTQTIQNVYQNLFSNNKYVTDIKKRMSGYIDTKVNEQLERVNAVTDQLSMINATSDSPGSGLGVVGGALSSMLGSTIAEAVSKRISPTIKDRIKDNKLINAGANYIDLLANNPASFFASMRDKVRKARENADQDLGIGGTIKRGFFGGLGDFLTTTENTMDTVEIKSKNILGHANPAIFDNKVHRSITEVIPLFLSKILKQNTDLTTMYSTINSTKLRKIGYKESESLVYNFHENKLDTKESVIRTIEEKIIPKKDVDRSLERVSNSMLFAAKKTAEKDKDANKADLKLLSDGRSEKIFKNYVKRAGKIEGLELTRDNLINLNINERGEALGFIGKDLADLTSAEKQLLSLVKDDKALATILKTMQKHKLDEKTEVALTRDLEDVKTTYPTARLIDFIQGASKLAGSKLVTQVPKDVAQTLAKGFSAYLYSKSFNPITLDELKKATVLVKAFTEKERAKVESVYSILISDINKIIAMNDIHIISSLEVLLGAMNKSLADNAEFNIEVLQTLEDLYPGLFGKGKITAENVFENKVTRTAMSDDDPISIEKVKEMVKTSKAEIEERRTKGVEDSVFNRLSKGLTDISDEIKATGTSNPFALGRAVVTGISKFSKQVKEELLKGYGEVNNSLGDISSKMDEAFKKLKETGAKGPAKAALGKVIPVFDTTIAKLKAMKLEEEKARDREKEQLTSAKSELGNIVNDPKLQKELEKNLASVDKHYKVTIESITRLENMLTQQKSSVETVVNSPDSEEGVSYIATLREKMSEGMREAKNIIETYKAQVKAIEDARNTPIT